MPPALETRGISDARSAVTSLVAGLARAALGGVAQALGGRNADQHRLRLDQRVEIGARFVVPGELAVDARQRRVGAGRAASIVVDSGRMLNSASNSALQTSWTM